MNYPEHRLNFRPPLSYIDIGKVIYNSRYLDIYNYARDEYMRSIGYPYTKLNMEDDKHLAVVEANIKYRKPVHYDEETVIVSKIEKISSRTILFHQLMYKNNMSLLCNEAKFVMVCIDNSFKASSVPEGLKKAFENGPL
ncbi:MAG: acyl-CoA thioesterase [Desulfobacteraceae bacterium]|nr:acyl-CoA thioesterase [Desulfobacteraceae bacterium]MCB9495155.1 acyl-CoA thioesterase [Desulfobacteraceae bacterium]